MQKGTLKKNSWTIKMENNAILLCKLIISPEYFGLLNSESGNEFV